MLKPKGLDITKIITDPSPNVFDNILHAIVGIAAMQIGLCDVLKAIGIEPDFMIGKPSQHHFYQEHLLIFSTCPRINIILLNTNQIL